MLAPDWAQNVLYFCTQSANFNFKTTFVYSYTVIVVSAIHFWFVKMKKEKRELGLARVVASSSPESPSPS